MLVPFLEGFDYTNTAQPAGFRPVTTTAPQALMLLNSEFLQDQAAAFAERLRREAGPALEAQVERAYLVALGRRPSARELEIALGYLRRQEEVFAAQEAPLTFTPQVPSSIYAPYLRQLRPEDFLAGPREGWSHHRGRWGNGYEGIDITAGRPLVVTAV
jgi:hypothetical protein